MGTAAVPDLTLVREVQMRATGANIHAVSQQLQIYMSAVECGAVLKPESQKQACEAGWRRAGKQGIVPRRENA